MVINNVPTDKVLLLWFLSVGYNVERDASAEGEFNALFVVVGVYALKSKFS